MLKKKKKRREKSRTFSYIRFNSVGCSGSRGRKSKLRKEKKKEGGEEERKGRKITKVKSFETRIARNIDFDRVRLLANKISSFKAGLVRGLFLDVPQSYLFPSICTEAKE